MNTIPEKLQVVVFSWWVFYFPGSSWLLEKKVYAVEKQLKVMKNTQYTLKPKKKLYVVDKSTLKLMKKIWAVGSAPGALVDFTFGTLMAHFKFICGSLLGARALSIKRLLWCISVLAHF